VGESRKKKSNLKKRKTTLRGLRGQKRGGGGGKKAWGGRNSTKKVFFHTNIRGRGSGRKKEISNKKHEVEFHEKGEDRKETRGGEIGGLPLGGVGQPKRSTLQTQGLKGKRPRKRGEQGVS